MGQQLSSECFCQDGFMQLCAPEDPNKESQNTFQSGPVPPEYPMPFQNAGMDMVRTTGGFEMHIEDRAFVAAPPPAHAEVIPITGLPPPSPSGGTPPPLSPMRHDITPEDIISNIEGAEEVMYVEAFATFTGGRSGYVALDSATMRDFICTNSAICMQDIDMELLKVTSTDDGLTCDAFKHLLREFPVSEGDAISQFLGLSADGEQLASEECRTGLLLFAQQKLSSNFSEERWECILNAVMWDAGMTVTMEQWLNYCKCTGRMVRLLRLAQVQKLALGSRSGGKSGGRGGA